MRDTGDNDNARAEVCTCYRVKVSEANKPLSCDATRVCVRRVGSGHELTTETWRGEFLPTFRKHTLALPG